MSCGSPRAGHPCARATTAARRVGGLALGLRQLLFTCDRSNQFVKLLIPLTYWAEIRVVAPRIVRSVMIIVRLRLLHQLSQKSGRALVITLPRIFAATLSLTLIGCTVTRTVRLYPLAPPESAVLQGVMVGHGQGHGTAKITMTDGEILLGEYSIVFGGSVGFGSILARAYGPGTARSVNGTSVSVNIDGRGEGTASLVGERGTSAQCEFLNANMTGHGSGACRLSNGSVYRMLY